MKKASFLIMLCILSILASGCATRLQYIGPTSADDQKIVHMANNKSILGLQEISEDVWVEVMFEPSAHNKMFNGMAIFWVYVRNLSDSPMIFGRSNIEVRDKKEKVISVMTLDKVVSKFKSNKSAQDFQMLLASSFLAALEYAPNAYVTQTGNFSGYTNRGQYVQGTYQSYQPNYYAKAEADRHHEERMSEYRWATMSNFERAVYNINRLSLRPATIHKDQFLQGIILVPLQSFMSLPNEYNFVVRTGDQETNFQFYVRTTKN